MKSFWKRYRRWIILSALLYLSLIILFIWLAPGDPETAFQYQFR